MRVMYREFSFCSTLCAGPAENQAEVVRVVHETSPGQGSVSAAIQYRMQSAAGCEGCEGVILTAV